MTDTATTTAAADDRAARRRPSRRTSPSPAAPAAIDWYVAVLGAVEQIALHGRRRPHRPRRADDRRRPVHAVRRVPGVRPRHRVADDARRDAVLHARRGPRRRRRPRPGRRRRPGPGRPGAARRGLRRPHVRHGRPVRPPLDDPDADRHADDRGDPGRHATASRSRAGAGRAGRRRHRSRSATSRSARPTPRVAAAVLRRPVRLGRPSPEPGRRVRPRRQHEAADGPDARARRRGAGACTSGSTTSPATPHGSASSAARSSARRPTTPARTPSASDDQGREFQLWQPAPGYE